MRCATLSSHSSTYYPSIQRYFGGVGKNIPSASITAMSSVTITVEDYAQLNGKNVIVTGGSTGIGEATIRLLHGAFSRPPFVVPANVSRTRRNDHTRRRQRHSWCRSSRVARSRHICLLRRLQLGLFDLTLQIGIVAWAHRHRPVERGRKRSRHSSRIGSLTQR